jgi:hypothetical protein
MKIPEDRRWIIRYSGSGFYMTGPGGELVENKTPRQLAHIAWAKGAWEVVFDFDLNLDPDK